MKGGTEMKNKYADPTSCMPSASDLKKAARKKRKY